MRKRTIAILALIVSAGLLLSACTQTDKREKLLNAEKPITVTLWHYYNGNIKDKFDSLVSEFNETIGVEKGIVIEAKSQSDVNQLATAVFDAANKTIGAAPMPDIFAAYPENAFRVNEVSPLVDLSQYFNSEELSTYRKEFLAEGQFGQEGSLYILPIAKSTENLYVNKTSFDNFANANGFSAKDLETWEGLNQVAKAYYEKTGKGFFGIDANANFMLEAGMQLGTELFVYEKDGKVKFNLTENVAKEIWKNYYVPYINGYFVKTGRFSSDDAKTGTVLSYTGSTAGAAYFPTEVSFTETQVMAIEPLILAYPHFASGKPFAIQQGAGMCIAKSDEAHEYAASLFLKWFTEPNQNLKFAVSTGYLPVKNEALTAEALNQALADAKVTNPSIKASFETTIGMLEDYTFYNNKPFKGSFEMRTLLESHLYGKINRDLEKLNESVKNGGNRKELIDQLVSDQAFSQWYQQITESAKAIIK